MNEKKPFWHFLLVGAIAGGIAKLVAMSGSMTQEYQAVPAILFVGVFILLHMNLSRFGDAARYWGKEYFKSYLNPDEPKP